MNALVIIEPRAPAVFTKALELAHDFAKAAKSAATQRAFADQAAIGKRPSTLGRRLAAIRYFHRAVNEASPTAEESVKAVLAGIRRTVGAVPVRRKKAATFDIVIA
jgi:hypothetical protein